MYSIITSSAENDGFTLHFYFLYILLNKISSMKDGCI